VRLVRKLPDGTLKNLWEYLVYFILLFIAGYVIYGVTIWNSGYLFVHLVVSGIFLCGAIFVYIVCLLTLNTISDIQRISVLEQETIIDPLMGIFNRRYLERRLDEEFSRSQRYHLSLSLLMLDIDHFKNVNDVYGHQAGDIVLKNLARLIVKLLRETDFVARYGGDEVVVILPNTTISDATVIAERIRMQIFEHLTIGDGKAAGRTITGITVSIGVSCVSDKNYNVHELTLAADKALYQAKEKGRNRIAVYDSQEN
ncbi:MAG: GGDEF domain-containing protein, partial [Gammaproteobacteria bacterium]